MGRVNAKRVMLAAAVLVAATVDRTHAQQPGWPMLRADAQGSSISQHFGVRKVALAWQVEATGWNSSGLPSVGPDGTIYFIANFEFCGNVCRGDQRGELLAVSPDDGSIIWSVALEDSLGRPLVGSGVPMIDPDGNVYLAWLSVGLNDGSRAPLAAQAFDSAGNLLWRFEDNVPLRSGGAGMIGPDGTLYLTLGTAFTGGGDEHSSMFAIDSATGELKWRMISPNQDDFIGRPALGFDGKLYYASAEFAPFGYDGFLYRIDPATGEIEWSVNLGQRGAITSLTIDHEGNLYLVDRRCVKYDTQGNVLWTYDDTGNSRVWAAAVVWENRVYLSVCCSSRSGVHVLDAGTGRRVDILEPGRFIGRDITLDRSGNVYFIADSDLVGYTAGGQKMWEIPAFGTAILSVVIGHDGLILAAPVVSTVLRAYGSSVLVGDLNCDGAIDAFDIEPYILILFDPESYAAAYPDCDGQTAGDINVDGSVNGFDIEPFLNLLFP